MKVRGLSIFLIAVVIFSSLIFANGLSAVPTEGRCDKNDDCYVYPDHENDGCYWHMTENRSDDTCQDCGWGACPCFGNLCCMHGEYVEGGICCAGEIRPREECCIATDTSEDYPLGDDPYTKGSTTCASGGPCEDQCVDSNFNPTLYSGTLEECYCPEPIGPCAHKPIICGRLIENYICYDGACVYYKPTTLSGRTKGAVYRLYEYTSKCTGNLSLTLKPRSIEFGGSVAMIISGLSDCDGKTVYLAENDCYPTAPLVSSCVVEGSGCSATFSAPTSKGDHLYVACFDMDDDGIAGNDPGEVDTTTLTVSWGKYDYDRNDHSICVDFTNVPNDPMSWEDDDVVCCMPVSGFHFVEVGDCTIPGVGVVCGVGCGARLDIIMEIFNDASITDKRSALINTGAFCNDEIRKDELGELYEEGRTYGDDEINAIMEAWENRCLGSISLNLNPNPTYIGRTVEATSSGFTNCDGRTVHIRRDSCGGVYDPSECSCTISGSGCYCNFNAPSTAGSYVYYACVDLDGDYNFAGWGEYTSKVLYLEEQEKCYAFDPPDCDLNDPESYPCGFDPFVKGDAVSGDYHKKDWCEPDNKMLIEYYCDALVPLEPGPPFKIIDCEYWENTKCLEGACICWDKDEEKEMDLTGDIDGNWKVNILDIASMAWAFGSKPGDPRWKPEADLDLNEVINIVDIAKAAKNFGKDCSCKQGTYNSNTGKCEVPSTYTGQFIGSMYKTLNVFVILIALIVLVFLFGVFKTLSKK